MKIERNKIIEATEDELYSRWLKLELDDLYAFDDYLQKMKANGVSIIDNQ